jgi:hypothetical protein
VLSEEGLTPELVEPPEEPGFVEPPEEPGFVAAPEEPEVPLLDAEPDVPLLLDVVTLEPVLLVAPELVVLRLARAGSCPVTRVTAISSHTATNSATPPATIRLRIMLTRARRALRIAAPNALDSEGRFSAMFGGPLVFDRVCPARVRIRRFRSRTVSDH